MPRKKIEPVKIPDNKSREIVDDLSTEEVEKTDGFEDVSIAEPKLEQLQNVNKPHSESPPKVEKETVNLRKQPDEHSRPTTIYEVAKNAPRTDNDQSLYRISELSFVKIDEIFESSPGLKSFIIDAQGIDNINESELKLLFYIWGKLLKISGRFVLKNSEGINSILDLTDIIFDRE